jgi:hypothetical protein
MLRASGTVYDILLFHIVLDRADPDALVGADHVLAIVEGVESRTAGWVDLRTCVMQGDACSGLIENGASGAALICACRIVEPPSLGSRGFPVGLALVIEEPVIVQRELQFIA